MLAKKTTDKKPEASRGQTVQILILKLMTNEQLPLFKEKQTFTSHITLDFL